MKRRTLTAKTNLRARLLRLRSHATTQRFSTTMTDPTITDPALASLKGMRRVKRATPTNSTRSSTNPAGVCEVRTEPGVSTNVGPNPDPRVTFANERTFLAWTRTSLALIGAGLAVAQFLKLGPRIAPLLTGIGLITLGAATSLTSYRQWQRNQHALRNNQPVPACIMPHILARGAALFAVVAVVLAVLAFSYQ